MLIFFYRKIDLDCDESIVPKKRTYMQDFGTFRIEDFKNKMAWNRLCIAFNKMKKDKLLLQRKNKRLLTKIQTFQDVMKDLKRKNLLAESVTNMLNVSSKID